MATIPFERTFDACYGEAVPLAPGVRRVTCNNPGPFTFFGTNSYLIGEGEIAVLDPGPADAAHISALLDATKGEVISKILISHTHADHSPGARLLKEATGAPIYAEGPHRAARALHMNEINPLDASADHDLEIDEVLTDGSSIEGRGWSLEVLTTPGHTANHICFAFADGSGLFSADHVMAWSTSIVAPPDGSMADYMSSLSKLMGRQDKVYWPGHGGIVSDPQSFMAGLKSHREEREAALLARLEAGDETIETMVSVVYKDVDRSLHAAAALSMFAQLEYLVARGLVDCVDPIPTLTARYLLKR